MEKMTSREEIERLLNQTSRTLEGLPEDYSDEKLKVWNSFRDKTFGHVKSFDMANRILHQSDVIELLVAALRDALEAQQSKWISIEESKPKEFVSVQVYMTDAGDFPSVREGYYVDVDRFYIPALHEFHPVSHWKPFDEPPEENE